MRNLINVIIFNFLLGSTFAFEASVSYPVRKISLISSDTGFYPESITAFKGETLKLFFTSTQDKKSCALIKGHRVFMTAKKGEVSEAQAFVGQAGEYEIYCPSSKFKGKLVVLSKKRGRRVASEKPQIVGPWVPKDYSE